MTTIIVTDEGMYGDGRTTAGNQIHSEGTVKVHKYNGCHFAACGDTVDMVLIAKAHIDQKPFKQFLRFGLADGTIVFRMEDGEFVLCDITKGEPIFSGLKPPLAMGSGERYALAAMDFGKTPVEAIAYAMTRDMYTGGKITSILFNDVEAS